MKNLLVLLALTALLVGAGALLYPTSPVMGGVLLGFGILLALITAGAAVKPK